MMTRIDDPCGIQHQRINLRPRVVLRRFAPGHNSRSARARAWDGRQNRNRCQLWMRGGHIRSMKTTHGADVVRPGGRQHWDRIGRIERRCVNVTGNPNHADLLCDGVRGNHGRASIHRCVACARSSVVVCGWANSRELDQATSNPGPALPCVPRILRASKLTLPGGQPKNSSHGS